MLLFPEKNHIKVRVEIDPLEKENFFCIPFFNFSSNLIWIQGVLLYDLLSSFAP